ncbi:MAG: hypothetical protein RLZZ165_2118 [Bacteroidota bacterium]
MEDFRKKGHSAGLLMRLLEFPRSTYYYKAGKGPPGRKASGFTALKDGSIVPDAKVTGWMVDLLGGEFVDYGYRKVTEWLCWKRDCVINHKKVLRLMREHGLMLPPKAGGGGPDRRRIVEKVPQPVRPREVIELDIKFIRVHGQNRNAVVLNFIDLFHREWLPYYVGWKISHKHVMEMVKELFGGLMGIKPGLRFDNGSQFVALELAELLSDMGIGHEFIRQASPEQNAHIESFHSVMQRAMVRKHQFETLQELKGVLEGFRQFYNHERLHSATCFRPPMEFLRLYIAGMVQEKFDSRNRRKFILRKEGPLSPPFSEHNCFSLNNIIHNQLSLHQPNG